MASNHGESAPPSRFKVPQALAVASGFRGRAAEMVEKWTIPLNAAGSVLRLMRTQAATLIHTTAIASKGCWKRLGNSQ